MSSPLVTVVIPTIKPRKPMLRRAVNSILAQDMGDYPDPEIEISMDRGHDGAAVTRNRALMKARTPWVAFLDDDDFFLPHHLRTLLDSARNYGADVVYPNCRALDPDYEEIDLSKTLRADKPFSAEELKKCNYIPVTSLVKREAAQMALFGPPDLGAENNDHEDYGFYLRLLESGRQFYHVPEVTWVWHHHTNQTAGKGDRW